VCGLAGLIGKSQEKRQKFLTEAGASLRNRGPDGEGLWNPPGAIGLTHRRLAIVDLSEAGAQPMVSADGRWVMAFNGELYNYRELRGILDAEGVSNWRGQSDTEVLLEAIARWGLEQALRRCNGMFAIAAWDCRDQVLSLARDRTGEKPLYVGWIGGDIVFASELKALRCHPAWRHVVDPVALSLMLSLGYVPAPLSIHPHVFKLPAASILQLMPAQAAIAPDAETFANMASRYWLLEDVIEAGVADPWRDSKEDALEEIQRLVDESVGLRMVADVPVGALLSGGIDSTLVVASMVRQSSSPIRTFTIGFNEPGVDESRQAESIAACLGTRHETIELPFGAALSIVERVPAIYDEPFADIAQLPALLVAKAARRQVTVALTGDGGDELFHGYQRYLDGERVWKLLGLLPSALRNATASGCRSLAAIAGPGKTSQRLLRQTTRIDASNMDDYYRKLLAFPGALTGPSQASQPGFRWPLPPKGLHKLGERMRFVDQALTLPEGIHTKLDRSSMAVGLELRTPLLDHRLLALSWRMPLDWHADAKVGKKLLRMLVSEQAPPDIASRRKQGFDVPISAWLRGPLREWAQDLLSPASVSTDPMLNTVAVQHCLDDHLSLRTDHGYALWALLMYRAWSLHYG